ncbi:MAG: BTAD domain-containing putative transcriptional regulator [Actinomycetota bacterium]
MKRMAAGLGLVAFLALLPAGLLATVGGPFIPDVSLTGLTETLRGSYLPVESVMRAFGLVCWGLWGYLLTVVVVRLALEALAARGSRSGARLASASGRLAPPFIRRLVDLVIGGTLVVSSLRGVAVGEAHPASASSVASAAHARHEEAGPSQNGLLPKYLIKPGDTLWDIAEDHLGSGYRWRELYGLNRGRLFGGVAFNNPRHIHPGWVIDLPPIIDSEGPSPAIDAAPEPQEISVAAPTTYDSKPRMDVHSSREREHAKARDDAQRPIIDLPSGGAIAASFASGVLAAQALSTMRRRRARRALDDPEDLPEPSLVLDIRRRVAAPAPGHLETAVSEVVSLWRPLHAARPRVLCAVEEPERAVIHLAKPKQARDLLPPQTSRVSFREESKSVRAEVRRPFPCKMVREETPLETGLLIPVGAGSRAAVHLGLAGAGCISITGERAASLAAHALLACAANSSCDDIKIFIIGDFEQLGPCRRLNHVTASVGWEDAANVLHAVQTQLLGRARSLMAHGVEDVWQFCDGERAERPDLVLVVTQPPPAMTGIVEAIADQGQRLGASFVALGWSPRPSVFSVEASSRVELKGPVPFLPARLRPLELAPHEIEQAVEIVNSARPPGWDGDQEEPSHEQEVPAETVDSGEACERPSVAAKRADVPMPVVVIDDPLPPPRDVSASPEEGRLEVRAFGNFYLVNQGRIVEKGLRAQSRELLAYLVAHPPGVVRDRILNQIWPELDAEAANVEFDRTVYYLRRRVGSKKSRHIERIRGVYRLNFEFWWTDVAAFESLLRAATAGPEDAMSLLSSALHLYSGPFCDDCYYAWLEPIRHRYRSQFVKASARLANLLVEFEQPDEALAALDRGIEVDPVNEDLYRRAMAIEGRLGRRRALYARLQRLEAVLQDELDVDPDEETAALFRKLMGEIERGRRPLSEGYSGK